MTYKGEFHIGINIFQVFILSHSQHMNKWTVLCSKRGLHRAQRHPVTTTSNWIFQDVKNVRRLMSCRLLSRLHNCVDLLCIQMCIFLFYFSKVNINIIFLKRQTLVHVCICPYYLLVEGRNWPVQTGRQAACACFFRYLLIFLNWNSVGFAEIV